MGGVCVVHRFDSGFIDFAAATSIASEELFACFRIVGQGWNRDPLYLACVASH